jgi:peptidoglycan/LPS O-acetylase OafA/YrhL
LLASRKGFVFNKEPFTGMYSPSQILPNLFLIQAWTPLTENLSFNYPSWSISIEYYMYILFAGVSFFCFNRRYLVWIVISMGAFLLLYNHAGVLTEFAYKGLSCFFAGALSYGIFEGIRRRLQPTFLIASLLEVFALVMIVLTLTSDLNQKAIISSVLFCSVITLFAFDAGVISRLLQTNMFTFLGRLSYSIYLTHIIVLSLLILMFLVLEKKTGLALAPMIGDIRYLDSGNRILNNVLVALVLVSVVAISYVTYSVIEVNGQKIGRYLINAKQKKIPAAT